MDSARLVRWGWLAAGLLVLGCDFAPGIADHSDAGVYPPCTSDLDCLESCVCLGGSVCVPISRGEVCTRECDSDTDCQAGAQNASALCYRGACKLEGCTPPYLDCDGLAATGCESDPNLDPANCGGCAGAGGRACAVAEGEACAQGTCTFDPCAAGWNDCDQDSSCESDPQTDAANCGACLSQGGLDCGLQAGVHTATCEGGACVVLTCLGDLNDCNLDGSDGCESDPMSDHLNCGGCAGAGGEGMVCDIDAGWGCSQGSCVLDPCLVWFDCDGDDICESNPLSDAANCGGCFAEGGLHCGLLDHVENGFCQGGVCQLICDPSYSDCDLDPATGCETDTSTSMTDCGACAQDGGALCDETALQRCEAGQCVLNSCYYGYFDCDDNMLNSCESNPMTDSLNCGACLVDGGVACDPWSEVCAGGACVCAQGFAGCSGQGDCTPLGTPDNCGFCGDSCPDLYMVDPLTVQCLEAQCAIGACQFGFADCDREPGDGCEAYLFDDIENCGGCRNACVTVNVSSVICVLGECDYEGGCLTGFGDCDGDRRNGCEANLHQDPQNCLECGNPCSNGQVCTPNGCGASTCDNGWTECVEGDDFPCETLLGTLTDCLFCGNNCWLSTAYLNCVPGTCYPVCSPELGCSVEPCGAGRMECDQSVEPVGEACETPMSAAQCGSCAHDCWQDPEFWANNPGFEVYPTCTVADGGQCEPVTCEPPLAECDLQPEACETSLAWATDCGDCGRSCASYAGTQCALDGSCTIVCDSGACVPFPCPPGFVDCNFEDNVPCETQVVNGFDCQACAGHCPSGLTCLDGVCRPNQAVVCGGQTCLPSEVCCVSPDISHSLSCQDPGQADSCLVTLTCTSPADCPQGQACCRSTVGGMSAPVACRSPVQCDALGILCDSGGDCTGDLGVEAYCCANPLLPGFSTCSLIPCNGDPDNP
jgi:hypothetical protein